MVNFSRFVKHLFASPRAVQRHFPPSVLQAIEQAISKTEKLHGGELRFAVEGSLDGPSLWRNQSPHERAVEVFGQIGVWDTAANNGVLIYLLLADHAVEIVADRGFDETGIDWQAACRRMEEIFVHDSYEQGALVGIATVGELMAEHFPAAATDRNELPDAPFIL